MTHAGWNADVLPLDVHRRSWNVGTAGMTAAMCRHIAQPTTPASMRYNKVNVVIGIHKPGIGVTASDVRIT